MTRTEDAQTQDPVIQVLRLDQGIPVPSYAMEGDAGADLCTTEDFALAPGQRRLVPTGIAIALPLGFVGLVHPRSGLAVRHGITVVNAPGTVDSGYRGEIKVTLLNTDTDHSVSFSRGDRIAQLVIQRVEHAGFVEVSELDPTERGAQGFGSTGGFAAHSSGNQGSKR
ncbi:MAG: dUTP diphosphatase [Galactobacter sp.]|uniref:dUTP diphosphatase n=1 Tax=Galactobacter sp. TaxID=2676125 RepID=UPI0025C0C43C|nr:dUTP diphosphatase [Galactobacter sp.]